MRLLPAAISLLLSFEASQADAQRASAFDYYLLALSWSPSWCEITGDERSAQECEADAGLGWTLHGLWPQYEESWPEWCESDARDPSRRETEAMRDIMGSAGLARYQWEKHGRCSGLEPDAYFELARRAVGTIELPPAEDEWTSAGAVERAFLARNPEINGDGLVVTCRDGLVMEVRICFSRGLEPRDCAPDVTERACRSDRPLEQPPPR